MQFLNNDSNEWMRKAAEDYPVKPFGMNWDAVAGKLTEQTPGKAYAAFTLMRYAAMVVFFMLLSLVCNKYLQLDFGKRYTSADAVSKPQQNALATPNSSNTTQTKAGKSLDVNGFDAAVSSKTFAKKQSDKLLTETYAGQQLSVDKQTSTAFIPSVAGLGRKMNTVHSISLPEFSSGNLVRTTDQEEEAAANTAQEPKNRNGFVPKRRLYAGLVVGPDISSVKFQKTEGIGFNLGLLLGYQLSPRLQVESGLLLSRKEYYSGGEYFNASRTYLPTHAYITKIDGYCTMFEIPLNLKYNISQKKQANWFVVAGVSSYLMNKEDYNYTYKRYNVEYKGSKVYRGLNKEWLTAVNASVGYEKAINEKIQIRLEPYVKLPLRGMGTGRLPISSAGMNVGISYPIK